MPQNVLECLAHVSLAPLKISLPPGQLALEQKLEQLKKHVAGLNVECDAHEASSKKRSAALSKRFLGVPEHLRATLQDMLTSSFSTAQPAFAALLFRDADDDDARAEEEN
jgi:hypothetical protein